VAFLFFLLKALTSDSFYSKFILNIDYLLDAFCPDQYLLSYNQILTIKKESKKRKHPITNKNI